MLFQHPKQNNKKPINLSIIGSCVSRDPFEIIKSLDNYNPDNETTYCIDRYIQSVSIFSAMSKPLPKDVCDKLIKESESSECANFFKKMFKLDISKSLFSYVCESNSEWLILDFANNRFPLISYLDTLFSHDLVNVIQSKRPDRQESDELLKLCGGKKTNIFDLDENLVEQMLSKFVSILLKRFPQNRIIILNAHCIYSYIDPTTGNLASPNYLINNDARRAYKNISFCYEYIVKQLPRAHYVDLPLTVIGNTKHKWGKYYMHYVDEAYEYLYRAFDLIMASKLTKRKEKERLRTLKEHYTKVIFDKYSDLSLSAIQRNRNLFSLDEFANSGTYTQNGLTLTVQNGGIFTLTGTATENTIFYLLSHSKNPLGEWNSIEKTTKAGSYCFSSKVGADNIQSQVQLVLTNDRNDMQWIRGNYTNTFTIDHDYKYRLIRILTNKDTTVNVSGELILEKMLFSETDRNV